MNSTSSPKVKRDTFERPRPLTQSEIASLRQDAISTSAEMKRLIAERRRQQQ